MHRATEPLSPTQRAALVLAVLALLWIANAPWSAPEGLVDDSPAVPTTTPTSEPFQSQADRDGLGLIIFGAVVALLGSAIGLGGALGSARISADSALRRLQKDHALLGRREAYLELSGLLVRLRAASLYPDLEVSEKILMDSFDENEWFTLQARIEAFGSLEIRTGFDDALSHRTKVLGAIAEWQGVLRSGRHGESDQESLQYLRAVRDAAHTATQQLLDRINRELTTASD